MLVLTVGFKVVKETSGPKSEMTNEYLTNQYQRQQTHLQYQLFQEVLAFVNVYENP